MVTFKTIFNFLKKKAIIPATVIGGILLYLVLMGNIEITAYSKDTVCAGNSFDPCYAYINFTVKKGFTLNLTEKPPFEFSQDLKEWKLQRFSSGKWIDVNKYSFTKGKNYSVRIIGYKFNPEEDIKWGAWSIDPIWEGINKSDYVKMIENVADITSAYTIYEVCNPTLTNYVISTSDKFRFNFYEVKNRLTSFKISIEKPVLKQEKIETWDCVNSTIIANETPQIKQDCSWGFKGWNNYTVNEFIAFNPIGKTFQAGKCYNIKIEGTYPARLGGTKIDNTITYNDIEFKEYEWWDSNWAKCKTFPAIEQSAVARLNYHIYKNYTGLTFAYPGEVRIVNGTCSEGGGISFPYKIVSYGTDWVALTVLANISPSYAGNFSVFYDNSVAENLTPKWQLFHHYDFVNFSLTDKSGWGNSLSANKTPTLVTAGCQFEQCYDLNGTNQFLQVDTANKIKTLVGDKSYTISIWAKLDSSATRGLFQYGQNPYWGGASIILAAPMTMFGCPTAWDTGSYTVPTGAWNYYTFIYNSTGSGHFYLNGSLYASDASVSCPITPNLINIGHVKYDNPYYWDGLIDEFDVWNSTRTDAEIKGDAAPTKWVFGELGAEESAEAGDTEAPAWSNNQSHITATYNASFLSHFNITWTDDTAVTNVTIEGNWSGTPTNYSMANPSGDVWNYSVILPIGSHYWKSYARDAAGNQNITDTWNFVIAKGTPVINLTLNSTSSNITLAQDTSIWINGSRLTGDSNARLELYIDGVLKANNSVIGNYTSFSTIGLKNVSLYYIATQNYTNLRLTYWVTVIDVLLPTWSNNQSSTPAVYSPTSLSNFSINWTDNVAISSVLIEGNWTGTPTNYSMSNLTATKWNHSLILPSGSFYWKSYANDTSNNWNSSDTWYFTIAQATPISNLTVNGNSSSFTGEIKSYWINGTVSIGDSNYVLEMYINGTLKATNTSGAIKNYTYLTAGVYNITLRYKNTQNYSERNLSQIVTIIATPPTWSNNQSSVPTIYDPAFISKFNITWIDNVALSHILFESNYSGTPTNYTMSNTTATNWNYSAGVLPVGSFYWKSYANDTSGNWNSSDTWYFSISRANPTINLTVNGSASSLSIVEDTSVWINGSVVTGDSDYTLQTWKNTTLIATNTSGAVRNYTAFNTTGTFNISLRYVQTQNYSDRNLSLILTVVPFNFTLYLDGLAQNRWYELGTQMNVSVISNSINTVCLDLPEYRYGTNFYCNGNTTFNKTVLIDSFRNYSSAENLSGTLVYTTSHNMTYNDSKTNTTYQESAESYSCEGNWWTGHPCSAAYDNNWDTSAYATEDTISNISITYIMPKGTLSQSLWEVKVKYGIPIYHNLTFTGTPELLCFNYNGTYLYLKIISDCLILHTIFQCYNSTDWYTMAEYTGDCNIYEERMIWDIETFNHTNKTVYLNSHKYEDIQNLSMNISIESAGFGNTAPDLLRIFINDTLLKTVNYDLNVVWNATGNPTGKNFTLNRTELKQVYLKVPKLATVTTLNLTLRGLRGYSYQENADKTAIIGSNYYVNYTTYAGEWDSTTPQWLVKHGSYTPYLEDILAGCQETVAGTLMLRFYSYLDYPGSYASSLGQCYNGSSWLLVTNIANNTVDTYTEYYVSSNTIELYDGDWTTFDFYAAATPYYGGKWTDDEWVFEINVNGSRVYEESMRWFNTPVNVWISVAYLNTTKEWSHQGVHNTTNYTSDFSSRVNTFLNSCTADDNGDCFVPIWIFSYGGTEEITVNSVYTLNLNPIELNVTPLQNYLLTQNGYTTIPLKFELNGGRLIIENTAFDYIGGNKTYSILAHTTNYEYNKSLNISLSYSDWDYVLPNKTNYFEFIPATNKAKNVSPYGQGSQPILNITGYNYASPPFNVSIMINESDSCVNLSVASKNNVSQSVYLNPNVWNNVLSNMTYLTHKGVWMWAHYNCTSSVWRLWQPSLYFRTCANNSVCDTAVG